MEGAPAVKKAKRVIDRSFYLPFLPKQHKSLGAEQRAEAQANFRYGIPDVFRAAASHPGAGSAMRRGTHLAYLGHKKAGRELKQAVIAGGKFYGEMEDVARMGSGSMHSYKKAFSGTKKPPLQHWGAQAAMRVAQKAAPIVKERAEASAAQKLVRDIMKKAQSQAAKSGAEGRDKREKAKSFFQKLMTKNKEKLAGLRKPPRPKKNAIQVEEQEM